MSDKTITIQIGNSDDKLPQKEWSDYIKTTDALIRGQSKEYHFSGASFAWDPWQNMAWVIVISDKQSRSLKDDLWMVRKKYGQDSIAWTEGTTEFV